LQAVLSVRRRALGKKLTASRHDSLLSGNMRQDQRSDAARAWRRLYRTAAWRSLRQSTFARDLYTCQICKRYAGASPICDHIRDHKGNAALFHDPANLRTLCKPCHDRHAQAQSHGTMKRQIGADGWPVE